MARTSPPARPPSPGSTCLSPSWSSFSQTPPAGNFGSACRARLLCGSSPRGRTDRAASVARGSGGVGAGGPGICRGCPAVLGCPESCPDAGHPPPSPALDSRRPCPGGDQGRGSSGRGQGAGHSLVQTSPLSRRQGRHPLRRGEDTPRSVRSGAPRAPSTGRGTASPALPKAPCRSRGA